MDHGLGYVLFLGGVLMRLEGFDLLDCVQDQVSVLVWMPLGSGVGRLEGVFSVSWYATLGKA